jgi:hypothetical protein
MDQQLGLLGIFKERTVERKDVKKCHRQEVRRQDSNMQSMQVPMKGRAVRRRD